MGVRFSHPQPIYWGLAQLVERLALNQQVRGSKPLSPAIDAYSKIKKDNNFSFQEEFKWFESINGMVGHNDTFPVLLLLYFGVFVYRLLQWTVNPPRQVRFLQTPKKIKNIFTFIKNVLIYLIQGEY